MDRVTRRRVARAAIRAALALAVLLTLARVAGHTSIGAVGRILAAADMRLLVVAVPSLLGLNFIFRAARFQALLEPGNGPRTRLRDVVGSVLLSQGGNNVLPLRAGELLRTRDFVARGYSLAEVALAQATEKVVELASLLVWTVPVLVHLVPTRALWLVVGVPCALLLLLPWMLRGPAGRRLRLGVALRARLGLAPLAQATVWSLLADALEVGLIVVCLCALGIPARLRTSLTVLATVNLAIAFPSTPAQIGAFEAGSSLGLRLMGEPIDAAMSFALLYHGVQWLPVTLAAGVVWMIRRPPAPLAGAGAGEGRPGAPPPASLHEDPCDARS